MPPHSYFMQKIPSDWILSWTQDSTTTNSYCKCAKTGQSPRESNKSQASSSDSDSDQDMDTPSNTQEEDHTLSTPRNEAINTSMGDNASAINGGIQDDDISETMLQACNNNHVNHKLLSESFSHKAEQDDCDL